jgi:hypothetical protein
MASVIMLYAPTLRFVFRFSGDDLAAPTVKASPISCPEDAAIDRVRGSLWHRDVGCVTVTVTALRVEP